jgi:hypothetical protein
MHSTIMVSRKRLIAWVVGGLGYLFGLITPAAAFNIVISNRVGTGVAAAPLLTTAGQLLAPQSAVIIGLPSGQPWTTSSASAALVAREIGTSAFWAGFLPFGPVARVGLADLNQPGIIEQEVRATLLGPSSVPYVTKPIWVTIFDTSDPAMATEWLVVEFPSAAFQRDLGRSDGTPIEGQKKIHLGQAVVHVGTRELSGALRLSPMPRPSYTTWAGAWITLGRLSASTAAPLADPDMDTISNLLEYVHGMDPSRSDAHRAQLSLRPVTPLGSVRIAWDQALLPPTVSVRLNAGPYFPLTATGLSPTSTPVGPGRMECQVTVPAAHVGPRWFGRAEVTVTP